MILKPTNHSEPAKRMVAFPSGSRDSRNITRNSRGIIRDGANLLRPDFLHTWEHFQKGGLTSWTQAYSSVPPPAFWH